MIRLALIACLAVLSVAVAADAGPFARLRANRQARRHPQPAFAAQAFCCGVAAPQSQSPSAWQPQHFTPTAIWSPRPSVTLRLRVPAASPAAGTCPGGACPVR